ncbi:MAG: hypothetical protein FJ087_20640, partial [Deltaproteobacteria bacterium]|nr:hypothetical protein [Deltaproteobacteria bacterium]
MVPRALVLVPALLLPATALAQVHYTYLWHLEQPIYWPAPDGSGNRYQRAWESMQAKLAGAAHPADNLDEIFGKDDRVAAYQWRPKEALATLLGHPEAGVQVSYSGGLIENVRSLASAGALGYAAGWNGAFVEARGWKTSQGTPRMDVVMFPFHHPLLPLTDDRVVRMELALYAAAYAETWGAGATSKGLFPPEMAFSERLIPALADAGLEWVIVSNSHISRACEAYPWVAGSGGDNIPPPNRADVQNPAQAGWNRITIDRGVSPANAYPFSYRPHRARFVDPASGQAKTIIVVPAAQGESWKDGYSCYGLDEAAAYAGASEPDHPILVVLAHDGDNAFGGGYSYYMECVPALANTATSMGYVPTTIAGGLADHPVAADDVVHVEDGAWVNADGDFGAPTFWNWNWPLVDKDGNVDPANGWAEDERNFAVIVAATNWVLTAEDAAGPADPARVLHAESPSATKVERAWHFLLGALNSGYMYYGKALDMELKPVVASNEAVARAKQAIPAGAADKTPPTVFAPQHWPDNPGGLNYGPLYKYKQVELPPRALFWTFAYDVSGVATAVFRYRLDADGKNPLGDDANETYAGGAGIDAWEALPMAQRAFPKENVTNDPEFDTSVLPAEIADVYWVELTGVADRLVDWYVEVADEQGNVTRTPIRHLYVGSAGGDPGGGKWTPAAPDCDDAVTVTHPRAARLHWGIDGWQLPPESLWPAGTVAYGDGKSVETPMTACEKGFCATLLPFDDAATVVDFVVHNDDGSWDNNGGSDWHIPIAPCGTPDPSEPVPDPPPLPH